MYQRQYIYSGLIFVIFVCSFFLDDYFSLVVILACLQFVMVLEKLGRGIVLRELIAFHTVFICLLIPILGYTTYNRYNPLAVVWVRYMPVDKDVYFSFCLPAVAGYCLTLTLPFLKRDGTDSGNYLKELLDKVKSDLKERPTVGVYMMAFGVLALYFSNKVPVSFQFILNLVWLSSFAGFLYVFYATGLRLKKIILLAFGAFIIGYSLSIGMFTIIAYMGMLMSSYLFLGKRVSFVKKLSFFLIAGCVLLIIQSVKPLYRQYTWEKGYEGSKLALFYELAVDRIQQGELLNEEAFFPIYYRTNQGFNISMVMMRIPKRQPHDFGKNLTRNMLASLVPRFLWPDKPEAGGKFNMKFYAGYNLVGFSTNIGPLGEAYGSFGRSWGIVYMAVLGFFIRLAYQILFRKAAKIPALVLWVPVIFFQVTYSAEADTLQIMNSLTKSGLFVLFVYLVFPELFLRKEVLDKRKIAIRRRSRRFQLPIASNDR